MVSYSTLVNNGWYHGHVSEIFSDMSIFNDFAVEAKKFVQGKDKRLCHYINDIKGHLSTYYARQLRPNRIDIRKKTIAKKNLEVSQQWWTFPLKPKEFDGEVYFKFIKELSDYIVSIYKPTGLTLENIKHGDQIALYEPGDFSELHQDGKNIGRCAAIIMYFGENYNDGGGEFVFGDQKVEPIMGNFVMLDFTKNNLPHAVNVVKNNFMRLSYLDFVTNIDQQ